MMSDYKTEYMHLVIFFSRSKKNSQVEFKFVHSTKILVFTLNSLNSQELSVNAEYTKHLTWDIQPMLHLIRCEQQPVTIDMKL